MIRRFIPLHGKNYIEIVGRDTKKFLQGLVTNDMNHLSVTTQPILATGLLNPKGRVVTDLFLYDLSTPEEQKVLLEVNHLHSNALLRYLTLYKLRSSIKIETKNDFQTILKPLSDDTSSSSLPGSFFQSADPRIPNLIDRILVDRSVSATSNQFDKVVSLAEYEVFRLLNGLPESEELEGHIPLEYNLDLLNYISFTKGCYIGQELTARTKYRGVVRKRVVPFIIADKSNSFPKNSVPGFDFLNGDLVQEIKGNMKTSPIIRPSLSSPVFRRSGGESVGIIVKMGQYSNLGLALMKLQELKPFSSFASEEEALESDFVVEGNSSAERVLIRPFRPNWWLDKDPVSGNPIIPPTE